MTNKSSDRAANLLPIGVDDYKALIDNGYIYVDKSLLIQEFWDDGAMVTLVTRPRRFGKSIALSMMRYFFERQEQSTAYLFAKTAIWKQKRFHAIQGAYPVIFLSFKDVKYSSWEEAYEKLQSVLAKEVYRTLHSLELKMNDYYRSSYEALIKKRANSTAFSESLLFITEVNKQYLHQNTIILIDEYDTPITHAYIHGYYEKMIGFMRNLFSSALKGNEHLQKGFMTGVLRTAKDGVMSGLNNPKTCTLLDRNFADKFGFTQEEVEILLKLTGRDKQKAEVQSWYNGYVVGAEYLSDPAYAHCAAFVYNPWSILSYLEGGPSPKPYWVNTGSVELLEKLVMQADKETQKELQLLLAGKNLEKKLINQDVILLDLDTKQQEPWSFLLFAGYITAVNHIFQEDQHYYTLAIPNKEIMSLYKNLIEYAISRTFSSSKKLLLMLDALTQGEVEKVKDLLGEFIINMCSSHDLVHIDLERSLHLFLLGLLASLSEKYTIKSNLESGYGRYDILMHPKKPGYLAVIIEFKKGTDVGELDKLSLQALKQIKEKKYATQLRDFDYEGDILCYGIAVCKKHVVAKLEIVSGMTN